VEHHVELIPDEVLEHLALEGGPKSVPARILRGLRRLRARDWQVFAFRVGNYWITGPLMDARTEAALIDLADEDAEDEEE
jgi:hypothetical protein